jgi:hypothetical protein
MLQEKWNLDFSTMFYFSGTKDVGRPEKIETVIPHLIIIAFCQILSILTSLLISYLVRSLTLSFQTNFATFKLDSKSVHFFWYFYPPEPPITSEFRL